MMYGNLISTILICSIISINGQFDDDRDLPQGNDEEQQSAIRKFTFMTLFLNVEVNQPIRSSKSSFDAHFRRGRCPDRFYQVGNECLFFGTDGERYSWNQAQRVCARQVARRLRQQTPFSLNQVNMTPTKGVRQLVLNTPEKTKILEALYREYDELHIVVRLPADFKTLRRCRDGKEDNWPHYCTTPDNTNVTCFETSELGSNNICLRQTQCTKRRSRLACEFTLPGLLFEGSLSQLDSSILSLGSPELTQSTFRHCPKSSGFRQRLTVWAWILVAVGAMLLLLLILGGVLAFLRNSKRGSANIKQTITESHTTGEKSKVSEIFENK